MSKKIDFSKYIEAAGFNVGDVVEVVRRAEEGEFGWVESWVTNPMDKKIGKTGIIQSINGHGVELDDNYYYPPLVLRKVQVNKTHCLNPFGVGDRVIHGQSQLNCTVLTILVDSIQVLSSDGKYLSGVWEAFSPVEDLKTTWKICGETWSVDGGDLVAGSLSVDNSTIKEIWDYINSPPLSIFCADVKSIEHIVKEHALKLGFSKVEVRNDYVHCNGGGDEVEIFEFLHRIPPSWIVGCATLKFRNGSLVRIYREDGCSASYDVIDPDIIEEIVKAVE